MRHKKQKHSKTVRQFRNIHEPIKSVIKNADLDKHRREFLGKPGSKEWHEFYIDLINTKRRLFKEESAQDQDEKNERVVLDKKRKTLKVQEGGDYNDSAAVAAAAAAGTNSSVDNLDSNTESTPPASRPELFANADFNGLQPSGSSSNSDSKLLAELIKKMLDGISKSKPTTTSKVNRAAKNVNNTKVQLNSNATPLQKESEIKPVQEVELDSTPPEKPRDCKVPFGWLVDLFETKDMKDLLIFAKKQVSKGYIKVSDAWKEDDQSDKEFDPTTILEKIIKNPKKGPCKAEDIKIQYIPFFLQVYMQLIANMRELVRRKKTNDIFKSNEAKADSKNIAKSDVNETPKADGENADSKDAKTVDGSVKDVKVDNVVKKLKAPETELNKEQTVVPESVASAVAAASEKSKDGQNGGAPEPVDVTEQKSSKVRKLILFSINLLRNMNMYANPLFFDDLYYYYYFLNLDKVFPSMDDFFRMFDTPEPEPKKNNSKVNVKMRVYEQFPNDDPSEAAQEEKHYGYEMVETRTGSDSDTNFDWFLNLVQLHPDFYYKLPVVAETEKEFLFEEVPVDKDKPDGQQNVKIQVVNKEDPPKQEGGGFFDSIYSVFGFSGTSGLYRYLDDSPLPRMFEDVLKDENDVFDGTVNLCIYSLDNSCDFDGNGPTPFLKFISVKKDDKWGFPSFHYKSLQDHQQNNSSFKCELYNAIMDNLEIHLCDGIKGGAEQNVPVNRDESIVHSAVDTPVTPLEQKSTVDTPVTPLTPPASRPELFAEQESAIDTPVTVVDQRPAEVQQPEALQEQQVLENQPEPVVQQQVTEQPVVEQQQPEPVVQQPVTALEEQQTKPVVQQPPVTEEPFSLRRPDESSPSLRLENPLTPPASRPELFAVTEQPEVMQQPVTALEEQQTKPVVEQQPVTALEEQQTKPIVEQQPVTALEEQQTKPVVEQPPVTEEQVTEEPENKVVESPESQQQEEIIVVEAKEGCGKLDSALDPMFIGLMMEDGQLFVFLNYDYLSTIVQTPENQAQTDLLFCRNDDTKLYPINDANTEAKLKWATVDELLFEQKILTEDVDPTISAVFAKHYNLWNIEDSDENYIDFPFVVYAVEKMPEGKFKTIETVSQKKEEEDLFILNGKIENYGTNENEGDEYDARYCFTIVPFSAGDLPEQPLTVTETETPVDTQENANKITGGSTSIPKRYAMFAWKTRYVVNESQVQALSGDQQQQTNENGPVNDTNSSPDSNSSEEQTGGKKSKTRLKNKPTSIIETIAKEFKSLRTLKKDKKEESGTEDEESGTEESDNESGAEDEESGAEESDNESGAEDEESGAEDEESGTEESEESENESVKEKELEESTVPADTNTDEEVKDPAKNHLKLNLRITPDAKRKELEDSPEKTHRVFVGRIDETSKEDDSEVKDKMALERLKFPTIYTITNNEFTDNKPVVMWGVLNSKQFTSL
jgi:hypothetical protein